MAERTAPTLEEVARLHDRPLLDLVFEAAQVHRRHHDPLALQLSVLLSVKTGGCPEDCAYCPQSAHHDSGVEDEELLPVEAVLASARRARRQGADRFCMGAAWREVRDGEDFDRVIEMVTAVKELGLETCVTLGMLDAPQAQRLRAAGLDYYNHNLDTSEAHYRRVISTRDYEDRLRTLRHVREAGIKVCCGGILGLGESVEDRVAFLAELASMDPPLESVPINTLVRVEGTPLHNESQVEWDELVRTIAVARLLMPRARIRLSAGRSELAESTQALCFLAGANSLFAGEQLLTTPNPGTEVDRELLEKLGLHGLAPRSSEDSLAV